VEHISDNDLEWYAMLTLPETDLEPFEEHLLICSVCRVRLAESEQYVAAM